MTIVLRISPTALWCLVASAVISVVSLGLHLVPALDSPVAWGTIEIKRPDELPRTMRVGVRTSVVSTLSWQEGWDFPAGRRDRSFETSRRLSRRWADQPDLCALLETGFPLRCAEMRILERPGARRWFQKGGTLRDGVQLDPKAGPGLALFRNAIPTRVHPLPLLANVVIIFGVLYGLATAATLVRQANRNRDSRCPTCGYQMEDALRCPECGQTRVPGLQVGGESAASHPRPPAAPR
jgi:hypothetical protein